MVLGCIRTEYIELYLEHGCATVREIPGGVLGMNDSSSRAPLCVFHKIVN